MIFRTMHSNEVEYSIRNKNGYIEAIVYVDTSNKDFIYINSLFVYSEARNKGYANALNEKIIEDYQHKDMITKITTKEPYKSYMKKIMEKFGFKKSPYNYYIRKGEII